MGLRPTKTNENAGILRCFRISSLARTFKGAIFRLSLRSIDIPPSSQIPGRHRNICSFLRAEAQRAVKARSMLG